MNILVVGGGGREHALCWKLSQSRHRPKLFCAPGNAGTARHAENVDIPANALDDLLRFARDRAIDLTVVGPEEPLCDGLVDRFEAEGLRAFGPTAAAARLEGDKAYAKRLMRECGVPTADARVFEPTEQELIWRSRPAERPEPTSFRDLEKARAYVSRRDRPVVIIPGADPNSPERIDCPTTEEAVQAIDSLMGESDGARRSTSILILERPRTGFDLARQYVRTRDTGVVVKAAGLAKGKGVFVHPEPQEAVATLENLMLKGALGAAGEKVVIEEILTGPEVSLLALVDGRNIYILESAADHKRLGEHDTGPNTGGMGAYSPAETLTEPVLQTIEREVFVPIVDGLAREGVTYRGVLYAGLMLTPGGPRVLEFNCRLGDPETQPILMRLQSDLVDALNATIDGTLDAIDLAWDRRPGVCVVMAAQGYPDRYEKGQVITGLAEAAALDHVQVFHAGTALRGDQVVTAGGRVLGVTAIGDTLQRARSRAYDAAKLIQFDGAYLRGDIAMRVSDR